MEMRHLFDIVPLVKFTSYPAVYIRKRSPTYPRIPVATLKYTLLHKTNSKPIIYVPFCILSTFNFCTSAFDAGALSFYFVNFEDRKSTCNRVFLHCGIATLT